MFATLLHLVVYGLQFTVYGLRFTVYGLQFMVCSLWFTVYGLQFMVYSLRFTLFYIVLFEAIHQRKTSTTHPDSKSDPYTIQLKTKVV